MKIADYVSKRLSYDRDDRTSKTKLWDDAKLRGSVGTKKANKIIKAIDDFKMYR